jgi:membrane protein
MSSSPGAIFGGGDTWARPAATPPLQQRWNPRTDRAGILDAHTIRSNRMKPKETFSLLKATAFEWLDDQAPTLGAALAYYTVFSLAPLLIISIALAGLVFGAEAAQGQIFDQLRGLLGDASGKAMQEIVQSASAEPKTGVVATVIGFVTLLFGASGVFGQLQASLNIIWGVQPKPGRGILGIIRDRSLSFGFILVVGFLLLVSLLLTAGIAFVGKQFGAMVPGMEALIQILNSILSLAVITLLFGMMFKILPDANIAWRDVWIGAFITALLFTLGKFALGFYLGRSGVASSYGAAGSLIVLLLWVYYSSQVVFFGAEFTQVYANRFGSHVTPSSNAIAVSK